MNYGFILFFYIEYVTLLTLIFRIFFAVLALFQFIDIEIPICQIINLPL